ncbi:MAG: SpoIIE family protein phosphatase, partial [Prochloraceae cyanobacterium]
EQTIENATIAVNYLDGAAGTAAIPLLYFYDSLARLAIYNSSLALEQKQILSKINQNQKKIKYWAHYAPMNHLHKYYLIEAEKCRVLGKKHAAMENYDRAISLAKENEYLQEEALANEIAGRFYLAEKKDKLAEVYLREARYCYEKWGAIAKVKAMDAFYPQFFASQVSTISTSITSTTSNNSGEVVDLGAVLKASQTISRQMVPDKLLENLMKTVIENAGAQKGYLILPSQQKIGQQKSTWLIEAAGAVDSEQVTVWQSIPVDSIDNSTQLTHLSTSIVNYVKRTQENVVLSDASCERQFIGDAYIVGRQPKSILCAPLLNQGQLNGIIYLENNLITGAFTKDRIQILTMLSAQAAISIENSRLYQTLEDKVAQRTAQLAQANQEISSLNEQLKQENMRMGAELDVARQLQQMVLPKPEELEIIEGIEISGYMAPADEVGGDYYDVLLAVGIVTMGIGDVTGHGLESGILMLMAQTAVRTLKEIKESDPVKFLDTLNRTIYRNVQRMNSDKNLSLAILNYSEGKVSISGQHEETIVVRAGGQIECIDTMDLGLPIGIDDDIADFIDHITVELNPGDGVVLYTDGITEAFDINKEQYGMERLCNVISQNWQYSAPEIKEAVIDDVRRFIGEQKVFDDITLVVFKQQ